MQNTNNNVKTAYNNAMIEMRELSIKIEQFAANTYNNSPNWNDVARVLDIVEMLKNTVDAMEQ